MQVEIVSLALRLRSRYAVFYCRATLLRYRFVRRHFVPRVLIRSRRGGCAASRVTLLA